MANGYRIKEFITGSGGDAGYNTEYALVDQDDNVLTYVNPIKDDSGQPSGEFQIGEGSYTSIDPEAINERAKKGYVPFGTAMGPALGYEYGMKNSEGNIFRKFDAQGNLTEFLDQHGVFQPASSFQPVGLEFNASTGNLETAYRSPDSPRENIRESTAYSVNPFHEDQGGWLGEGGWKRMGMLALSGLSAGLAGAAGGAGLAGGAATGANALENAAALTALINSGSGAANALQIANQVASIGDLAYKFSQLDKDRPDYGIERFDGQPAAPEEPSYGDDQQINIPGIPSEDGRTIFPAIIPSSGVKPSVPGTSSGGGQSSLPSAPSFGTGIQDVDFEQEEREKEKEADEVLGLLSQSSQVQVKTPPPAEIDYFFDIGGDSMFATPKQESLMPSPFEEAPEAVEGAMPRYQYYDPQGGYQYADGGMVDEYTINDLYRMLGSK
jgi:hypothetical protein